MFEPRLLKLGTTVLSSTVSISCLLMLVFTWFIVLTRLIRIAATYGRAWVDSDAPPDLYDDSLFMRWKDKIHERHHHSISG